MLWWRVVFWYVAFICVSLLFLYRLWRFFRIGEALGCGVMALRCYPRRVIVLGYPPFSEYPFARFRYWQGVNWQVVPGTISHYTRKPRFLMQCHCSDVLCARVKSVYRTGKSTMQTTVKKYKKDVVHASFRCHAPPPPQTPRPRSHVFSIPKAHINVDFVSSRPENRRSKARETDMPPRNYLSLPSLLHIPRPHKNKKRIKKVETRKNTLGGGGKKRFT